MNQKIWLVNVSNKLDFVIHTGNRRLPDAGCIEYLSVGMVVWNDNKDHSKTHVENRKGNRKYIG